MKTTWMLWLGMLWTGSALGQPPRTHWIDLQPPPELPAAPKFIPLPASTELPPPVSWPPPSSPVLPTTNQRTEPSQQQPKLPVTVPSRFLTLPPPGGPETPALAPSPAQDSPVMPPA